MKRNATLLGLLLFISITLFSTIKAQVKTSDSLALIDLYNSTNGPDWTNHTNWLTKNPVNTWYGISVLNTGASGSSVYKITLGFNNLNGTIPPSLGNLKNLNTLYLPSNQLKGAIPSSIANLSNLSELTLNDNQLSGVIPTSIGNMGFLQYLTLNNNQLSGTIPSSIGNLGNLRTLNLGSNPLSGSIPSSIGNLVGLGILDLTSDHLSGSIPYSIGNLVHLNYLYLYDNQLSGSIPHSFHKLLNAFVLNLSYNQLTQETNIDYPSFPGKNTNVDIEHNRFTFDGLELLEKKIQYSYYDWQANLAIHQHGNKLSVYAGGTLSNNTYSWYKVGKTKPVLTIKGDSTFHPSESGRYYAYITNAVAIKTRLSTDTVKFTLGSITATDRLTANANISKTVQGLQAYPNPAKDIVKVRVNGTAVIIITNATGKVLLTKTISNNGEINVSNLANGTYYLQNKTTGETGKILVIH